MPAITELYAWVMEDTGPDDEGVPAFAHGDALMPMMGADMERAMCLRPQAVLTAKAFGKPIRLVRSTALEVVEVIEP